MKWIQIDVDPLKADFPMWGFADRHAHPGRLRHHAAAGARCRRGARRRRLSHAAWPSASQAGAAPARRRAKRRAAASANKGVSGALNPAFVFATLSAKLSQDDVVLNEAIRNGPVLQEHVTRTKPQSYVGLAGGGLGFSAAAWRWG